VKIQVEVFWVVTPCSVVVGYRRFGGPYCMKMRLLKLVSYRNTTRRHNNNNFRFIVMICSPVSANSDHVIIHSYPGRLNMVS